MQNQSQDKNKTIYPDSDPLESNNLMFSFAISLCGFSLISSVALDRSWAATFTVWRTVS
jgi:hypothetical protein